MAGAQGNFTGLGVTGESYGGGDQIMGSIFGGVSGIVNLSPERLDWYGEFSLTPLTFGRVGYQGRRRTIRSSFGWRLDGGAFLDTGIQTIEWGGGFQYAGLNVNDDAGRETGVSSISLLGQARYRF